MPHHADGLGAHSGIGSPVAHPQGRARRGTGRGAGIRHQRRGGGSPAAPPLPVQRRRSGRGGHYHPHDGHRPSAGFRRHRNVADGGAADPEDRVQRRRGQRQSAPAPRPPACCGDGISGHRIHLRRPPAPQGAGRRGGRAGRLHPAGAGPGRQSGHPRLCCGADAGNALRHPGDQAAGSGDGTRPFPGVRGLPAGRGSDGNFPAMRPHGL